MIYKIISQTEESTVFGRIDDDGLCRVTCVAENPELKAWLEQGNTPLPTLTSCRNSAAGSPNCSISAKLTALPRLVKSLPNEGNASVTLATSAVI